MAYTMLFAADFGSLAGLTLNAILYDHLGVPGTTITTGFVELGNGVYSYLHTAIPDGHRGTFVMYKAGSPFVKVAIAVNPEPPTANANADALLDRADAIEVGWTLRKMLRVVFAALAGKLSGAATNSITIRDIPDTKDRIVAAVDPDGNRASVVLDGT